MTPLGDEHGNDEAEETKSDVYDVRNALSYTHSSSKATMGAVRP